MPILFFSGVRTKYYAGGGAKTIDVVGIFDRRNVLEISVIVALSFGLSV